MKTIETYIAQDGTIFATKEECTAYEKKNTPEFIEAITYINKDKWELYDQLTESGYSFDEKIHGMLKYALNEVEMKVKINSLTGEVEIIEVDGKTLLK